MTDRWLIEKFSGGQIQSHWNHLFSNYDLQEDIEIHGRVSRIFEYIISWNILWYEYIQSLWNHIFSNYDTHEDIDIYGRVSQIFEYIIFRYLLMNIFNLCKIALFKTMTSKRTLRYIKYMWNYCTLINHKQLHFFFKIVLEMIRQPFLRLPIFFQYKLNAI